MVRGATTVRGMDDEVTAGWARRVRDARAQRGWTQEVLAERASLSQQKVSQVESGRPGSDDTRRAIARALGVRVVDLFPYPEDLEPAASAS
jgi:transcriptional regulator with XRE-family HTH domain